MEIEMDTVYWDIRDKIRELNNSINVIRFKEGRSKSDTLFQAFRILDCANKSLKQLAEGERRLNN